MLVAVDVDDVIADFCGQVEALYGPPAVFPYQTLNQGWPAVDIPTLLLDGSFHLGIPPVEGAAKAITSMWNPYERLDLVYITSRSPLLRWVTEQWLSACGFPPAELLVTGEYKRDVLRFSLQPDVLVDDMPKYLMAAEEALPILFDRCWNWGTIMGIRVKTWAEIVPLFKEGILQWEK